MGRYSEEAKKKMRLSRYIKWIEKSKLKFGNKFSHEHAFTKFETQKKPKVQIICLNHDYKFLVTPDKHIQSKFGGCDKCAGEHASEIALIRNKKKFLEWFDVNCSNRLILKSQFIGMTKEINLFCTIHNKFKKTKPTYLMVSQTMGCDDCSSELTQEEKRLNLDDVKKRLNNQLPLNIKLIDVEFNEKKSRTEIIVRCSYHGIMRLTNVYAHKTKYFCPECGNDNQGFASTRLQELVKNNDMGNDAYLGVLEVKVFDINAMKVGVTTRTLEKRYGHFLQKIFFAVKLKEIDIYVLENRIKRKFKDSHDLRILKYGMRNTDRWGGDTELYWFNQKTKIITFIKDFVEEIKLNAIDYQYETEHFIIPEFFPIDLSKEKDLSHLPIPVIGVDPDTNEIANEFKSISDAHKAGFHNVGAVISETESRQLSGGLRWFKKDSFDKKNIPKLKTPLYGKPIRCIETKELFHSTIDVEKKMNIRGYEISSSKVTSVCKGTRKHTNGFTWEYASVSHDEVDNQDSSMVINYVPPRNNNAKIPVAILSLDSDKIVKKFDSLTSAAHFLKSSTGVISQSIKKDRIVKGYKIKEILDEEKLSIPDDDQ